MIGYPIDWQPASDDGAGFGRHAEMSDAALDDEARTLGLRALRGIEPCEHCDGTGEIGWGQDFQMACPQCCGSGRAAQHLHNIGGMEAGGLLMMPPDAEQDHSDATGVA